MVLGVSSGRFSGVDAGSHVRTVVCFHGVSGGLVVLRVSAHTARKGYTRPNRAALTFGLFASKGPRGGPRGKNTRGSGT